MTNRSFPLPDEKDLVFKVDSHAAEATITKLKNEGLYDKTRVVKSEEESVWIPVKKFFPGVERKILPKKNNFQPTLKERFGLRAFDIIGDIIIIFIPDEQKDRKFEIGSYLLERYPRIKAVYMEDTKAGNDFRIQKKELVAGKGSKTIHRENGLQFQLDITKVFFSPRQAKERLEISSYVNKGEVVCVFFAGIAPIPIYLSKFSKAKKIIGIELNAIAYKYGLRNIRINKIDNVELVNKDVRKITNKQHLQPYDLVIMAEPKNSGDYFIEANKLLKENGRLLCYIPGSEDYIAQKLIVLKKNGFTIIEKSKGIMIGPYEWRYKIYAKKN